MSGSCVAIAFADGFADWESFDVFVAIEETLLVESLVGLSCQCRGKCFKLSYLQTITLLKKSGLFIKKTLSGDQGEFN
jgi:hypothetical protein